MFQINRRDILSIIWLRADCKPELLSHSLTSGDSGIIRIKFSATRVNSSTIVIFAILELLDNGFRSITITSFPIFFKASHLSPSSRGTRIVSASKIPSLWQLERGPSNPTIFASGALPSIFTSKPRFYRLNSPY